MEPMADKPILFSGPMVRAILEGRKTQTRRVIKPQPFDRIVAGAGEIEPGVWVWRRGNDGSPHGRIKIPYCAGDTLWVREAWLSHAIYDDLAPSEMGGEDPVKYLADDFLEARGWPAYDWSPGRYRASMHMPRWASRITLKVTDVRVQRLQEVSDADAMAEGIMREIVIVGADNAGGVHREITADRYWHGMEPDDFGGHEDAQIAFFELWETINGDRGFGIEANPWVAAYTFERITP